MNDPISIQNHGQHVYIIRSVNRMGEFSLIPVGTLNKS